MARRPGRHSIDASALGWRNIWGRAPAFAASELSLVVSEGEEEGEEQGVLVGKT